MIISTVPHDIGPIRPGSHGISDLDVVDANAPVAVREWPQVLLKRPPFAPTRCGWARRQRKSALLTS